MAVTANGAAAPVYSDAQLIVAARMYYIDEMSQAEIGKTLGVSQAKVSRMLGLARQTGIVQISVAEYRPRSEELEAALVKRFKLRDAIVVRRLESQSIMELRTTIGYFAAPTVSTWVPSGATVAVAGGRTLRALAERMEPSQPTKGITVIQAMGSIDETTGSYDALEIGRRLATRWSGSFLALNTPAILEDAQVCRRLSEVDQVRKTLDRLNAATVAMVGIGNLQNSVFRERNALKTADVNKLTKAGAVGEIVGRFYDEEGRECDTPFKNRVIGVQLDALRRMKSVIGVVAGSDRTAALRAAIRGKILKSLVLDDAAAISLLESPS
ncbi:sugar-binding transcriptional regulator [Botrimarina mediterranea]|uniref:Deoxyribonucleoside regulator n=1 Tax=Botrimarina mediterranea TaxID=2528022 RepID=A0A518K7Y0_9BACT|nr:sugar-binding domain-containing protein [Botrimarina mediterranea]QDV73908.1 Deoxyribonucleoside regulator [Botrimarina mediterranea]QDV78538.1 Deoxyribonucleoside regulator [Planctomycetes bacterium K2D]